MTFRPLPFAIYCAIASLPLACSSPNTDHDAASNTDAADVTSSDTRDVTTATDTANDVGDATADTNTGDASSGTCTPDHWPTASNTGIPSDAPALTVITDTTHTDHDGQIFDAVEMRGRLYVDHANVTIRRSRLVGDVYYAVYSSDTASNLSIEDCDVVGGVLYPDGFVARRNHFHAPTGGDRDDGLIFAASHALIEDNLIDGLIGGDGAHLDGIQIMAGDDIVIRHNWIEAVSPPISGGGVNAAVFFAPDMGPISNVTVDCNMLIEQDGYYPLRISSGPSVRVRHNRWRMGHLGAPVLFSDGTVATEWTDNSYEDGTVIPSP